MTDLERRWFVGSLAAALPARRLAAWPGRTPLDRELLRALGRCILPSALGADGVERAVTQFERWLDDYRADAELNHGYGTSEVEFTTESPRERWNDQLSALDREVRAATGRGFPDLDAAEGRELIGRHLPRLRDSRLPEIPSAPHVALALLAHFYTSPEGHDLGYQAAIRPRTCRPLGRTTQKPIPLPAPNQGPA